MNLSRGDYMAYKDKSIKTRKQNEFIAKAYDRINLTVPKGKKELIQKAAQRSNRSVNSYINSAIDLMMSMGDSSGNSEAKTENNYTSRLVSNTEPTEQNLPQYERSTLAELEAEKELYEGTFNNSEEYQSEGYHNEEYHAEDEPF